MTCRTGYLHFANLNQIQDNSGIETETIMNLIEKLEFDQLFERYRYLQKLMDGEIENVSEINTILRYILAKKEVFVIDGTDPFEPVVAPFGKAGNQNLLDELEKLLPTMEEEEDAHKGMWDTLIEIHGRESVKVSKGIDKDWDARSIVARLLIVNEFIQEGIQ